MPTPVRLVLAGALLLAAAVLLTIAVLGALGRLRRNPWAGVRTRGTLASDEAFTVANRVAAAPLGAAGIVALLGGVTLVVGGPGPVVWTVLVVATAGCWGSPGSAARSATGPRRGWRLRRRAARGRARAATSWPAAARAATDRATGSAPDHAARPRPDPSPDAWMPLDAADRSVVPGVERERRQQRQRNPLAAQHP